MRKMKPSTESLFLILLFFGVSLGQKLYPCDVSSSVLGGDPINEPFTNVYEPKGGLTDGSICTEPAVVQEHIWRCEKRFCCQLPCNCNETYLQESNTCEDLTIVGEVECLVLHPLPLRFYKRVCCSDFQENEEGYCTSIITGGVTEPVVVAHGSGSGLGNGLWYILALLLLFILAILAFICYRHNCCCCCGAGVKGRVADSHAYTNDTYAGIVETLPPPDKKYPLEAGAAGCVNPTFSDEKKKDKLDETLMISATALDGKLPPKFDGYRDHGKENSNMKMAGYPQEPPRYVEQPFPVSHPPHGHIPDSPPPYYDDISAPNDMFMPGMVEENIYEEVGLSQSDGKPASDVDHCTRDVRPKQPQIRQSAYIVDEQNETNEVAERVFAA